MLSLSDIPGFQLIFALRGESVTEGDARKKESTNNYIDSFFFLLYKCAL